MTPPGAGPSSSLDNLRHAFDQTFAAAPAGEGAMVESLVAVRVGEDHVALRVAEIAGIEARRLIIPLPVHQPALLGIASIRNRIVPVYSLARLFGYRETGGDRHWLALVDRERTLGFAFSEFEGHLRVPPGDIKSLGEDRDHRFALQVLKDGENLRAILSMPRIVAATRTGAAVHTSLQE